MKNNEKGHWLWGWVFCGNGQESEAGVCSSRPQFYTSSPTSKRPPPEPGRETRLPSRKQYKLPCQPSGARRQAPKVTEWMTPFIGNVQGQQTHGDGQRTGAGHAGHDCCVGQGLQGFLLG